MFAVDKYLRYLAVATGALGHFFMYLSIVENIISLNSTPFLARSFLARKQ